MAGNQVKIEFAGDASDLTKASKKAADSVDDLGKASTSASDDLGKASKSGGDMLGSFNKLGGAVSGASDAIDGVTGGLQALSDATSIGYNKNQRYQRALNDVAQAQEDLNQATRDGAQAVLDQGQAEIDATQAQLDLATATKQHAADVKEFGANSAEAKQDTIDMKQAQLDLKQANEDGAQALRDANQATIDAKGAQLDLNDAQREANPPDLQKWSDALTTYAPLLQGLVGITGLVTAAQWAWNLAQAASPTTWIILAIVALIAVIVLIATKTKWFQNAWTASWKWIQKAASNTWDWLKKVPGWIGSAFAKVSKAITAPFRIAFNFISDAWNNTIGSLSWSVPGWVPFIGGNTISVPHIPHFHEGGTVPGNPGSNVLAMLQAGEEVTSVASAGGGDGVLNVTIMLDREVLGQAVNKFVSRRGGNVQVALGSSRG